MSVARMTRSAIQFINTQYDTPFVRRVALQDAVSTILLMARRANHPKVCPAPSAKIFRFSVW
jgi:hypothetical protein